jgi:hypothetical protein
LRGKQAKATKQARTALRRSVFRREEAELLAEKTCAKSGQGEEGDESRREER